MELDFQSILPRIDLELALGSGTHQKMDFFRFSPGL